MGVTFFRQPQILTGFAVALFFQLIFSAVWMSAYSQSDERISQLRVAVVTLDPSAGPLVVEQMAANFPLQLDLIPDEAQARRMLNDREVQLVMIIPMQFSSQLINGGEPAVIRFVSNGSNATAVKSIIKSLQHGMLININAGMTKVSLQSVLEQTNLPAEQIEPLAVAMSHRVIAEEEDIHPVKDTAHQMIPMLVVLASYVGAMVMAMIIQPAFEHASFRQRGWHTSVIYRLLLNLLASLLVAGTGTLMFLLFHVQFDAGAWVFWGYASLMLFAFMWLSQWFLLTFGPGGMLFNIITLSVQLVTSGLIIPGSLLPDLYQIIRVVLPATYAVDGIMTILFGGPGLLNDLLWLGGIAAVMIGLSFLSLWLKAYKLSNKQIS